MKNRWSTKQSSAAKHLIAALPLLLGTAGAWAQAAPITTTAQLKAACQTNPARTVRFSVDTQINAGASADAPEQVLGSCRIELLNGADLKLDKVGLAFSGPLTVVGGIQSAVALAESTLSASAVNINLLNATDGYLSSQESRIDATVGNLTVSLGANSKLELYGARLGGAQLSRAALAAAGAVNVTAAMKHSAVLMDTAVVAGLNARMVWNGLDTDLKLEDSTVHSFGGDAILNFTSGRAKMEAKEASIKAPQGNVVLALRGAYSALKAYDMVFEAAGSLQIFGVAGATNLELNTVSLTAGGAISLASSAQNASVSTLDVSKAIVRGGNSIRFTAGSQSKVVIKDSDIAGTDLVEASVYFNSVCEAQNNVIVAPRQQICL